MQRKFFFAYGRDLYDIFILPTIRYSVDGICGYLTIEWLKCYFGVKWYTDDDFREFVSK